MATLANIFNNFTGAGAVAADTIGHAGTREMSDAFKLRPLPNEDVYFFAKRIDNSRVVKQSNPRARAHDWKLVGGAGIAAFSLIAMLLPSGYGLMAGYQINGLQTQHAQLAFEQKQLELEESKLVSMERLQALAIEQEFIDPATDKTVYLQSHNGTSVAVNRR